MEHTFTRTWRNFAWPVLLTALTGCFVAAMAFLPQS